MFDLIFRRLRLSEPWRYKAPFLISVPYFVLYTSTAPFGESLVAIAWSLCTIIGIAGFGYFSNDVYDRAADRKAGRRNGSADLSRARVLLMFCLFIAAALVPWVVYFPLDAWSIGLIVSEFVLLVIYSAPPLRLKERGIVGLGIDASYAHLVPAVLAAHTFDALTGRGYPAFPTYLAALAAWQFLVGLRNILTHQLADADRDRAAGTATYVTRHGEQPSTRLLRGWLAPLEIATWAVFAVIASIAMPIFGAGWLVYVAARAFRGPASRQLSTVEGLDRFLNEYTLRWLPLVVLVALAVRDPRNLVLLLLHLALFRNGLSPLFGRIAVTLRAAATGRPPSAKID